MAFLHNVSLHKPRNLFCWKDVESCNRGDIMRFFPSLITCLLSRPSVYHLLSYFSRLAFSVLFPYILQSCLPSSPPFLFALCFLHLIFIYSINLSTNIYSISLHLLLFLFLFILSYNFPPPPPLLLFTLCCLASLHTFPYPSTTFSSTYTSLQYSLSPSFPYNTTSFHLILLFFIYLSSLLAFTPFSDSIPQVSMSVFLFFHPELHTGSFNRSC